MSSGAAVKKGEKLGEVGETGMATGPHLHFELQKDGVYLNPIYYVGNRLSVPSPAAFFCWWDGSPSAAVGRWR